jgi:uncharacterized integral membrane protein (TIGR00697 family)
VTAAIGLYVACELIANVTAVKPVQLGPLVVPAGVLVYALTFTLLDLINERLGKAGARRVIGTALGANLLLAGYAQLTVWWPAPAFFDGQAAVARVLGATPRIVGASLLAYLASALVDAELFAWWRARVGGFRWLRVLVSNGVATALDSALFVTLAFAGVLPLGPLIWGQYVVKMAVTVLSLPLIYLVRRPPAAVAGLLALAGALGAAGGAAAAPQVTPPRLDPGQAAEAPTAIRQARAAVIGLRVEVPAGRPSAATLGTERAGSGVLISADGLALTVGYVVLEAGALTATLADGRAVPARVVGHDFESGLALIRLDGPGPYPALALGRSAAVGPGQPVAIIGMGDERRPVATSGRVTAVRPFVAYWEYLLERALVVTPLHPNFGGAALVDTEGALIGVVSLRLPEGHIAIPIDLWPPVREAVEAQGRPGTPARPWLGIRAVAVEGGVGVASVSPAGPAHAGGLRAGDVIVRLDGDRVSDVEDLYRKLWRVAVGRELQLGVYRDGRLETVTVRARDRYGIFQFRAP